MNLPSMLTSKIIETESFKDVLDYIVPSTLIFCDLDNTLIESSQYHGSIQWEEDYQKQLYESGDTHDHAWVMAHNLWIETLPKVLMRLVDEKIPKIIQTIAEQEITLLGLTARPLEVATITFSQLDKLGIYFDQRFIDQKFHLKEGTSFEKGVIFCDRINKKSEVLLQFLNHLEKPKRIIFVDDKIGHVRDIENAINSFGIDFVGIRLSKTDLRFKPNET